MFKLPANLDDPKSRISASSSPGVSYEHYEQRGFDNVDIKTLNKQKANLKGKLKKFGHRVPKGRVDQYALKLSASIYVPADGKYTFFTKSDDGSRLYINGKQVVNNDGKHGMVEKSGDVMLPGGMHSIVVTYFDNGGGDGLLVSWKGPGIKKQEIPAKALSTGSGGGGLQAAAVRAIGSLPGHEAEKFKDLATLLSKGKHREAAVGSILRIPESQWPRAEAQALGRNFSARSRVTSSQSSGCRCCPSWASCAATEW